MRAARTLLTASALLTMGALPASVAGQSVADTRDVDPELRSVLLAYVERAESFGDRFDAQVWLTDMSRRLSAQVPDHDERLEILTTVHQHATRVGVPPELVLAVIDVESNFDRFAISSATALGLMQVMPFWVDELGIGDGNMNVLFDIDMNIQLGCRILKYYLDMEDGDYVQGLARYNGSTGRRWYADRVLDRLRQKWFRR